MKLKETGSECVDSIRLAHDSDKWRDLVNVVINFQLYEIWGICGISEELWILNMNAVPWISLRAPYTLS
jgi:hypothetical protein